MAQPNGIRIQTENENNLNKLVQILLENDLYKKIEEKVREFEKILKKHIKKENKRSSFLGYMLSRTIERSIEIALIEIIPEAAIPAMMIGEVFEFFAVKRSFPKYISKQITTRIFSTYDNNLSNISHEEQSFARKNAKEMAQDLISSQILGQSVDDIQEHISKILTNVEKKWYDQNIAYLLIRKYNKKAVFDKLEKGSILRNFLNEKNTIFETSLVDDNTKSLCTTRDEGKRENIKKEITKTIKYFDNVLRQQPQQITFLAIKQILKSLKKETEINTNLIEDHKTRIKELINNILITKEINDDIHIKINGLLNEIPDVVHHNILKNNLKILLDTKENILKNSEIYNIKLAGEMALGNWESDKLKKDYEHTYLFSFIQKLKKLYNDKFKCEALNNEINKFKDKKYFFDKHKTFMRSILEKEIEKDPGILLWMFSENTNIDNFKFIFDYKSNNCTKKFAQPLDDTTEIHRYGNQLIEEIKQLYENKNNNIKNRINKSKNDILVLNNKLKKKQDIKTWVDCIFNIDYHAFDNNNDDWNRVWDGLKASFISGKSENTIYKINILVYLLNTLDAHKNTLDNLWDNSEREWKYIIDPNLPQFISFEANIAKFTEKHILEKLQETENLREVVSKRFADRQNYYGYFYTPNQVPNIDNLSFEERFGKTAEKLLETIDKFFNNCINKKYVTSNNEHIIHFRELYAAFSSNPKININNLNAMLGEMQSFKKTLISDKYLNLPYYYEKLVDILKKLISLWYWHNKKLQKYEKIEQHIETLDNNIKEINHEINEEPARSYTPPAPHMHN